MVNEELEVVFLEVDSIVPFEHNPKVHTQEQIEALKASILRHGFIRPILVDKKNRVIAGHGRVEAMKQLGKDLIPAHKVDMNELEAALACVLMNKLTIDTAYDNKKLMAAMELAYENGYQFEDLGMGTKLKALIETLGTADPQFEDNENYINQLVFYFEDKEYRETIARIDTIMASNTELKNNTEVFLFLVKKYGQELATPKQ